MAVLTLIFFNIFFWGSLRLLPEELVFLLSFRARAWFLREFLSRETMRGMLLMYMEGDSCEKSEQGVIGFCYCGN